MLHRLTEDQYERARPVFEALRYNLVIDSVIDGNTPAWLCVDDVAAPHAAWMWNRMDAMLLAGNAGNDAFNRALGELITEEVVPGAKSRHLPQLSLHYAPRDWESKIDVILAGKKPEKASRRYYTLGDLKPDWRRETPPGYEMVRMDEVLLSDTSHENMGHVVGWVRSFWRSFEDFVRTGFGFCLLRGDAAVSWCLSVYVSGEHRELGLSTVPEYRNQGLATLAAAACVEHCLVNGLTPHWHCWDDNVPSAMVAEKVGFERPVGYDVFHFKLL